MCLPYNISRNLSCERRADACQQTEGQWSNLIFNLTMPMHLEKAGSNWGKFTRQEFLACKQFGYWSGGLFCRLLQGEIKIICSCLWHVTLSLMPSPTFLAQILLISFKPHLNFTSMSHIISCLCILAFIARAKANNAVTTKNWMLIESFRTQRHL